MANFCDYEVHVNGTKAAVMMVYETMPATWEGEILYESGTESNYTLHYLGQCKWSVNFEVNDYWNGNFNINKYDENLIRRESQKYYNYSLRAKSEGFHCEILVHYWSEESGFDQFDHYKNGAVIKKRKIPYSYDNPNVFDWKKTEFVGYEGVYDESVTGEEDNARLMQQLVRGLAYMEAQEKNKYTFDDPTKGADTDSNLFDWTFQHKKKAKGNGWSIDIPDSYKVIESQTGHTFDIVPASLDPEVQIKILVDESNKSWFSDNDDFPYHPAARAALGILLAMQQYQETTKVSAMLFSDITGEVYRIAQDDIIISGMIIDSHVPGISKHGYNFSYTLSNDKQCVVISMIVPAATKAQKNRLEKSTKEWIQTFHFNKPNQSIPKKAWFTDEKIIKNLKQNKLTSFNESVDKAYNECKTSLKISIAAYLFKVNNGVLNPNSKTKVKAHFKEYFEPLEFYIKKADECIEEAMQQGVSRATLDKVYKKLLEEFVDIKSYSSEIPEEYKSLIESYIPASVTSIITKWKNPSYSTPTKRTSSTRKTDTVKKSAPTKKADKKPESKKKENKKLEEEKERRKAKRQLAEKQASEKYEKDSEKYEKDLEKYERDLENYERDYADWKQRCKEIDDIVKRNEEYEKEYQRKLTAWEQECQAIDRKRKDETQSRYLKEKERLETEVRENYESSIKQINEEKEKYIRKKAEAEAALSKIGFFGFSKKKILQESIDTLNTIIEQTNKSFEEADATYLNNQHKTEEKIKQIRSKISAQVNQSLPHPKMPIKEKLAVPVKPSEPISPKKIFINLEKDHKDIKVGSILYFGFYEQDSGTKNNPEMIEWQVLAKEKDKILVICRYGLGTKSYNQGYSDVNWETCSLRKWLNDDFFEEAFSETEQELIITVAVPAENNPMYNTNAGNSTTDKVFLLSIKEAEKYFFTDSDRVLNTNQYTTGKATHVASDYTRWWLRTPGYNTRNAAFVNGRGVIDQFGHSAGKQFAVARPAMWLNINHFSKDTSTSGTDSKNQVKSEQSNVVKMVNDTWKVNSLSAKIARLERVEKKDCESLKACIQNHTKYIILSGKYDNNDEYMTQLEIVKCILMIGQIKNIHSLKEMESLLGMNPTDFMTKFANLAFTVLCFWQISDVQYYDGLMNAVMKQFEDFNELTGNRVPGDIYKLYAKHR